MADTARDVNSANKDLTLIQKKVAEIEGTEMKKSEIEATPEVQMPLEAAHVPVKKAIDKNTIKSFRNLVQTQHAANKVQKEKRKQNRPTKTSKKLRKAKISQKNLKKSTGNRRKAA